MSTLLRGGGASGNAGALVAAAATTVSVAAFALGAAVGHRRAASSLSKSAASSASSHTAATDESASSSPPPGDALDCAVCLGPLVLPRVAPCGHSFCTPCVHSLYAHEARSRKPSCPTCRKRFRTPLADLPVNFAARAVIEARARAQGEEALEHFRHAEDAARECERQRCPPPTSSSSPPSGAVARLRPAWNWFKWTAIVVTEFGAFLVSLKEVLEAAPSRPRHIQALV